MPVGPTSITAQARPLTAAVDNAARALLRAGSDLLTDGSGAPSLARTALADAIRDARSGLRAHLRTILQPTAAAWLTGAQALHADVHALGVDPDRFLEEAVTGLQGFTDGNVAFDDAFGRLPDADGQILSAANQLAADLDEAFTAAARSFTSTMQDAVDAGRTDPEAAASMWNHLLDRGLTVPVAGRHMSVDAYAKAIAETRLTNAALSGYFHRATAAGSRFVAVSVSPRECPMCAPWEGRVLARSRAALARAGESADIHVRRVTHTFDQALAGGLFHPGCRHEVSAWVEGVSVLPGRADAGSGDSGSARLREIERTVAKWDRRAAFALTASDRNRARVKAGQWRAELVDAEHRTQAQQPAPAPAPHLAPPPAAAGPAMVARPAGVLLPEGADPARFTDTLPLRANAQGAAMEFTDDPGRNPGGHRFILDDLQAAPGHTGIRFRVQDQAGADVGGFAVTVVGPPRHPAVTSTFVDADGDLARRLGTAFTAAWSPARPAGLPRRNPNPVTGPYLHDWPEDVDNLTVEAWTNNSTGMNASFEVTFTDGSKGLYKPLTAPGSLAASLGVTPDIGATSGLREVAACAIDRALGLGLIPATTWWRGPNGLGSLQRWAAPTFPPLPRGRYDEVDRQRIAVLDYVIGNWDRHDQNYLTTHDGHLIAIDHGLSMKRHSGFDAMIARAVHLWWPTGRPLDAGLLARLGNVDSAALAGVLAGLGLPADEIEPVVNRLAGIVAFGAIRPDYQLE